MTDDVRRRDPEIDGDPQLTPRDLGAFPRRDLCRRVERDGVPYDFHLALAHPLLREKLLCEIRSFDLESSFYGGDLRQSKIVKDRRDPKELAVVLHSAFSTDQVGEEGRAHDVMEQERIRHRSCVLNSRAAELRVQNLHLQTRHDPARLKRPRETPRIVVVTLLT